MYLEAVDDQVLSASPQRAHPMSRGTLCVKGWNGHQIIHHQQRLNHPLLKQHHSFKSVSWQKAIQTVAKGLEDIKSRYGPDSIGVVGSIKCTNEANYVLGQFARAVIGTNNIDTSARFYQAPTMAALDKSLSPVAATASINDIEKSDTILLIGCNVKDEMAAVGSFCLQALHRGSSCIEMDYVRHELSPLFTLHLQPFAERILWVINAMIHHILSSKLYVNVQDTDLKDLAKEVEHFAPEQCEHISGIPAPDIIKAAETYATAEKSMILYGHGVTQSINSTQTIRALWNLALLTGHETGEGKGILPLMISNNLQGSWDMGLLPDKLPGQLTVDHADHRKQFETAWDCVLPETPGLTLTEMIDRIGKDIRALYIVGENLAWSAPDCKSVQKALEKLDFLVVQDLFLTETARRADVVLPAASFAEKDGTFTSTESRLQRITRAIPPVGSSKPDLEIITLLSGAMGKPIDKSPAEIFKHISQNVDRYQNIQFDRIGFNGGILLPKPEINKSILPGLDIKEMTDPPDQEYPYILIVERMPFHRITGTLTNYSFTLSKELLEGGVYINSQEARDLNIRTGWPVKIKTREGEVVRSVLADPSIPRKTLLVPVHHKNGLTLELLSPKVEPNSKTPNRICAAKLEI
ncbi:molybdopterin-dependent oxidoreductase [candidate division KSB1 bacterium]|nr:molybdopterin-dependent oxidoreductase [candidate division KSB1 bacterium]